MGKSRMYNPETPLAILDTEDTRRTPTKQNKSQHGN
jgi:hypothetical protein